MGACIRKSTLQPHRWTQAGGEFDSLTLQLESDFYNFVPTESVQSKVRKMGGLADNKMKKSRYYYWKGRLHGRYKQRDSAFLYLKKALELTDSSAYYYDFLRIKKSYILSSDTTSNIAVFLFLNNCLKYALDTKDKALQGLTAIDMGNLFMEIGSFDRALRYYQIADSLNSILGYDKYVAKNKINRATALDRAGKVDEASDILFSLLKDSVIQDDPSTRNLVYRNLYSNTGDTNFLKIAYQHILHNDRMGYLRGFYAAELALRYFYSGDSVSGIKFAKKAITDLPKVTDLTHKSIIFKAQSLAQYAEGVPDSALFYRIRFEEAADSQRKINQSIEVMQISAMQEIKTLEMRQEQTLRTRNITLFITVIILVLLIAIGILLFNRRNLSHKLEVMKAEIELERTRRKIMASAITIDEKDQLLGTLREELSDLRHNSQIDEKDARRLETTIKSHLTNHESETAFRDMFDTVNPNFTAKLKEVCPDLADSYIKIACYILMDLDNKQIGRLMMIKPESVRQARWRLRKRLKLGENDDLTEKLRELNS